MSIIGENIRKNRLKNHMSTRELAKVVGVSHTAINKYENGLLSPNRKMIRKMARILKVKTDTLIFDSSYKIDIEDSNIKNEERVSKKSKDLLDYLIKEKLEEYFKLIDYFPEKRFETFDLEKFQLAVSDLEDLEEKALLIRELTGTGALSIFNLLEVLENNGIIILFIESSDSFISKKGFVGKNPFIALNNNITTGDQRVLLANEFCDLILKLNIPGLSKEEALNVFIEAFLLSKETINNDFGFKRRKVSFYEIEDLKDKVGVPASLIVSRLFQLGIISGSEKRRHKTHLKNNSSYDKLDKKWIEKSNKFLKMVIEATAERYISYKKGAEFLKISENELFEIVNSKKQQKNKAF